MSSPSSDAHAGASLEAGLDAQALDALRQLDPDGRAGLLARVLDTYRASLERLLRQLDEALARADAPAMRLAVHTLKSSSASIGARCLSQLCADAELALRDGRLDDAGALLVQLRSESGQVDRAVQQLLVDPNFR